MLILLGDAIHRDGAISAEAGAFEIVAASLGILMTGIFVIGLIERRDRTVLRMGRDSALAIVVFGGRLLALLG
nr:hypothetical protein [uncultured Sphingomonas sp.]